MISRCLHSVIKVESILSVLMHNTAFAFFPSAIRSAEGMGRSCGQIVTENPSFFNRSIPVSGITRVTNTLISCMFIYLLVVLTIILLVPSLSDILFSKISWLVHHSGCGHYLDHNAKYVRYVGQYWLNDKAILIYVLPESGKLPYGS